MHTAILASYNKDFVMEYVHLKENEKGHYNIYIIPPHIDLSQTSFPDGLIVTSDSLDNFEEASKLGTYINHFMECMISDAKENVHDYLDTNKSKQEIIEMMTEGSWTYPYYDYSEEAQSMICYLRLVPQNMDLEKAGFSHGIAILNRHFKNENETEVKEIRAGIDTVMNQSYEAILNTIMDTDYKKKHTNELNI